MSVERLTGCTLFVFLVHYTVSFRMINFISLNEHTTNCKYLVSAYHKIFVCLPCMYEDKTVTKI